MSIYQLQLIDDLTSLITFFFQILLFTVSKIGIYGLLYIYWLIHFNLEKKPDVKTGILHSEYS